MLKELCAPLTYADVVGVTINTAEMMLFAGQGLEKSGYHKGHWIHYHDER